MIGGDPVKFYYDVVASTSKETVLSFFRNFTATILEPSKAIVVCDNHTAHKTKDVVKFMNGMGVRLYYLPPYSCRQNSIEHLWAHVKKRWSYKILEIPPKS